MIRGSWWVKAAEFFALYCLVGTSILIIGQGMGRLRLIFLWFPACLFRRVADWCSK